MRMIVDNWRMALPLVLGMLVFNTLTALAEDPPPYLLQWGSSGSGNGQFNEPLGVAVDDHHINGQVAAGSHD